MTRLFLEISTEKVDFHNLINLIKFIILFIKINLEFILINFTDLYCLNIVYEVFLYHLTKHYCIFSLDMLLFQIWFYIHIVLLYRLYCVQVSIKCMLVSKSSLNITLTIKNLSHLLHVQKLCQGYILVSFHK